jgi:hypothetical protein
MGRFERKNPEPGPGNQKGKGHGSMVGPLVGLLIARHPSFSTNPVGDWQELVGERVARYCQPKSLKEKILVVAVYDSVWKHHLELYKSALIEKINLGRSEPLVEKIVVRVSELSEEAPSLNAATRVGGKSRADSIRRKKKKKTPNRPLTADEKAVLKGLPDPELQAIGARLLKRIPLERDE